MATIAQQFGMVEALEILGVKAINEGTSTGNNHFSNGSIIESYSPVDGQLIAKVKTTTPEDYEKVMQTASEAFKTFRLMPAPKRGEIVRQFGEKLRKYKEPLGKLVSYEMLRFGLGIRLWHGFVVMFAFGNHLKKHLFAESLVKISSLRY